MRDWNVGVRVVAAVVDIVDAVAEVVGLGRRG